MRDHEGGPARVAVAVIDDSSQTRETFGIAYPALDVVGAYATVEACLEARPDVALVVLDLLLATGLDPHRVQQGPAAIRALTQAGYRVCLYTDERRPLVLVTCVASGASGLVQKSDSIAANQDAFIRIAEGYTVIPDSMTVVAELLRKRGHLPELTDRQIQVLHGRARGESWKLIGQKIGISPKTAYDHMELVMRKMVLLLQDVGLPAGSSPADVERALGLAPGDLIDA